MFLADAHADTLHAHIMEGVSFDQCAVTSARLSSLGSYLQTFALFSGEVDRPKNHPYQNGLAMLNAIPDLGVPIIRGALPAEPPTEPMGIVSIEGGEMLEGDISKLHKIHTAAAVRMIALTWNFENEIGYPSAMGNTCPLKPFGHELIREMDALGILVDVSHLNEAGFYNAAERSHLPIIASHSNLKKLCAHHRNLTDEQVRTIVAKKGFIGINFFSRFLSPGANATLSDVLRHIEGMLALGAEDVLGFGSDFDGILTSPDGLRSPSDFPNLIELLLQQNYSQTLVERIAGRNLWRVLKAAEKKGGLSV